jgi:uncharacterized protein GlcG (DUF336 family)
MTRLTLDQACTIIAAALAKARELRLAPMSVAVLDAGGHLVAFQREDRAGILREDIARGKAWGALGLGMGSRALMARAEQQAYFINAAAAASGGRLVPVPGGVLVLAEGEVVGAVGASGDTSDQDEACVVAGIEAAGLAAKVGA